MLTCYFEDGEKAKIGLRHVTVDGLVVKENQLLVVKRGEAFTCPHMYGLPGGYVDRDETVAQGAVREVREETGVEARVESIFAIIDKPDRLKEDRQNVNFSYLMSPTSEIGEPDHEIEQVLWFPLDQLPPEAEWAFDHYKIVKKYLEYRKQAFTLPVVGLEYD